MNAPPMIRDAPSVLQPQATSWPEIVSRVVCAFVSVAALLVGVLAYKIGILYNFFFLLMLVAVPVSLGTSIWGLARKRLERGFVRNPFAREMRWQLLQCVNRWLFWGLLAVATTLAIPEAQFDRNAYRSIVIVCVWVPAVWLMARQLFPRRPVRLSVNLAFAFGWLFLGQQLVRICTGPARSEAVVLAAPFKGEWVVFHGGRSALLNHHYVIPAQRDALDLCGVIDGRTSKGDPKKRESYPAFGAELFAPADGRVVKVVNDRLDMEVGKTDREQIVGNHVIIEIGNERFVLMAHLMQGSVKVSEGERVRGGQLVARCGNSGNTSEPHLHLQVQNRADFWAKDLRTFPILFRDVTVQRGSRSQRLTEADVRRNDRLLAQDTKS